jgi:hypothetical protein
VSATSIAGGNWVDTGWAAAYPPPHQLEGFRITPNRAEALEKRTQWAENPPKPAIGNLPGQFGCRGDYSAIVCRSAAAGDATITQSARPDGSAMSARNPP